MSSVQRAKRLGLNTSDSLWNDSTPPDFWKTAHNFDPFGTIGNAPEDNPFAYPDPQSGPGLSPLFNPGVSTLYREPTSEPSNPLPTTVDPPKGRTMAAAAAGAAIKAGGDVMGSTVSGLFGLLGQRERNSAMAEMAQLEREFKTRQSDLARSYGLDMQNNAFRNQHETIQQNFVNQKDLEQTRFSNTNALTQSDIAQKTQALRAAGLPDYLAVMPGLPAGPRVSQRTTGGRLYTSQLPGDPRTTPFTGSGIQQSMGWGALPSNY